MAAWGVRWTLENEEPRPEIKHGMDTTAWSSYKAARQRAVSQLMRDMLNFSGSLSVIGVIIFIAANIVGGEVEHDLVWAGFSLVVTGLVVLGGSRGLEAWDARRMCVDEDLTSDDLEHILLRLSGGCAMLRVNKNTQVFLSDDASTELARAGSQWLTSEKLSTDELYIVSALANDYHGTWGELLDTARNLV
jgi:hypothetical protein